MTMQTLLDKEVLICISINSNVWNWCVEIVDLEMSNREPNSLLPSRQ